MKRRSRAVAALLAVFALLFGQAMASVHACDVFNGVKASLMADGGSQDRDCCDPAGPQTDPACDNHCQQGKQAPERGQGASVVPLVAVAFTIPTAVVQPPVPRAFGVTVPDLLHDTQPPIPIRNCSFRI